MEKSKASDWNTATATFNGETADDQCVVNTFPKPFKSFATPFEEDDFDPKVRQASEMDSSFRNQLRVAKIIVVGDVAVGKTCLVNRFCHKQFNVGYKGTIGVDFEVKKFEILKSRFNLQLWDTAGQERFRSIASSYYRGAHAIVLSFDLHRMSSLQTVPCWLEETMQHSSDKPLLFLVGTKQDLLSPAAYSLIEKDAMTMAASIKAEFWPVSAKTGGNVQEFFNRIAALTFCKAVLNELDSGPQKKLMTSFVKISDQKNVKNSRKCKC